MCGEIRHILKAFKIIQQLVGHKKVQVIIRISKRVGGMIGLKAKMVVPTGTVPMMAGANENILSPQLAQSNAIYVVVIIVLL
jgi:hypothetical protein